MDKIAELTRRINTYKACRGILRAKLAEAAPATPIPENVNKAMDTLNNVFSSQEGRTWGGWAKDNISGAWDLAKSTCHRTYNPENEQFARNLNEKRYNEAMQSIQNGEYNGYDANQDISGNSVKQTDLAEGYDKDKPASNNNNSNGNGQVVINNNMPGGAPQQQAPQQQGGGGGMQSYANNQPGLADYMQAYINNRYQTR